MICMALCANAQQRVNISTYQGTDLAKYEGQEVLVTVNRYVFHGWNTLSLPFAVTADELNEAFGSDCRLECLVGVESDGSDLILNFQDCKSGGMQAGVPYILYYTGENATKRISKTATVTNERQTLSFTDSQTGTSVRMGSAATRLDGVGRYGILARDNAEAAFVCTDDIANGFYASRCFIEVPAGNKPLLKTNHIGDGEATGIHAVAKAGERVDVYTVSGVKVADHIDGLQPGIYVVKGRKVMVK